MRQTRFGQVSRQDCDIFFDFFRRQWDKIGGDWRL
jgi:hypothetical protein